MHGRKLLEVKVMENNILASVELDEDRWKMQQIKLIGQLKSVPIYQAQQIGGFKTLLLHTGPKTASETEEVEG
ncbi:hypothetical protein Tcan_15454 [Toxocara canis]|uniref:Uncharacterized protein n=2 Tax=Toxocara canis TaxID=6265 RepID=A0A0B2VEN9_TOXCA|nr:hypothetical protein Tcan_15454 [Toxocara canis]VDM23835.1 unnamed protein product [Toxocara canis]